MSGGAWPIVVVFGLLGALHLGLRWLASRPGNEQRRLRLVETCALGTRKRLHVVEVDGERLLIAASESGLSLLRALPAPDPGPDETAEAPPSRPAPPRSRWIRVGLAGTVGALALCVFDPGVASAQAADADPGLVLTLKGTGDRSQISPALEALALLTVVALAPSILLMSTCFTRIVIVLAFVRQAVGVQNLPPNQVLVGLALFLTLFVMAPLGERIRVEAYEPYVAEEIGMEEASRRGLAPVRDFLMRHTREDDLALFVEMSGAEPTPELAQVATTTLLPAFLVSELRTAFEIGFMIFLPFLIIDLVISSMLISMGMIVLPPIVVALPFKIMLFVLADGWNLILGSLVASLR